MLEQVLTALAEGAAGQAGQRAWAALAALARRGPGSDPATDAAIEAPGTRDPARLAEQLTSRAETDLAFAAELARWVTGTQDLLAAGQVSNQVTGPVSGTVIQARDITGGITFGGSPGDGT